MEARTFEADQFWRQQPKARRDWLVGITETIWRHIMELWESRTQDKRGIDADEEAKARPLMLPREREIHERHSHLPLNATETMLDVDLNTREKLTAHQLHQWSLIAEPT
jgi:hypothetical protein